jgi:hypothetical protein
MAAVRNAVVALSVCSRRARAAGPLDGVTPLGKGTPLPARRALPANRQRTLKAYEFIKQPTSVSFVKVRPLGYILAMTLREKVEALLPNWERWYPSLFDAASDLGIIRPDVCDPNSLLLTRRHAKVRQRAEDAHREKWGGEPQD